MKPVSILFLIVSVFLIIGGILTCCVGMIAAKAENMPLYDYVKNENGDTENEFSFEDSEVSRILIDVDEADVEIICGSDKNKVVIKNITSSSLTSNFECNIQNKTLAIEDTSLFSLTSIAQGKFNFKGFRYSIKYLTDKDKLQGLDKKITVYVKDICDIKAFDITASKGNVTIDNYVNDSDYNITLGEGSLTLSEIQTNSNIKCQITEKGNITLTNVKAGITDLASAEGNVTCKIIANEIKCDCGNGNVTLNVGKKLDEYNYRLDSLMGKIVLNGTDRDNYYEAHDANLTCEIDAVAPNGNITIEPYIFGQAENGESSDDISEH